MIGKKINQLATELAPASTDLTIIGNPTTGVSKKITLAQLGAIFSGAVSFYTNYAAFPTPGTTDVIFCAKDTQKLYLWSGSAYVEVFPSQALLDTYQLRSEKGVSNGYASLDSSGKVPISQLPSSIMEYKGTWNAATNTPTLANGTGDTGDVYLCNAAGTVNFGAGPLTFAVGDYVVYSGTIWQRSSGAVGTVTSVAASITGNAIGITGSPVTTSGTLALAFAGTSAQYVNGAGNLITFPSIISQAQNLVTEVYNETGATLTKGTIVYINGGHGNLPTVTKALATGDSTSAQTYGIVQADITNNNNGYVVAAGRLSDIDTQAYTEGTQLYLSSTTAGTWTSTKQYAPAHLVYVGIVVRAHPTQGVVEVKIQNGYELDELHNVSAQSPTNNDGIFYNSATSLWEKKSIATVLGYTPQAQLNGTGFVKASGTTISYDNSTYVTTDTFQTISASKTFGVGFSIASAGGTNQLTSFLNTNSIHSGSAGTNVFGFNNSNNIYFGKGLSNGGVITYNNSAVRFYALPDADGTIALVGGSGVGTVTSVGLSSATSGVTIGSTPITTSGTITLAIATASGSQQGLLSSTDWTTFNNKQSALTNPVTGTGTTNYLPKFTGTSTIGNSGIQTDASGNIGLNVTPTNTSNYTKLQVSGTTGGIFDLLTGSTRHFTIYNGSSSSVIGTVTNTPLIFQTNDSTRATLDASGNLGLGVTPSAWDTSTNVRVLQMNAGSIWGFSTTAFLLVQNSFSNTSGVRTYVNNGFASEYEQASGQHIWKTAPSGTAGNAISFTQAMTLNASGNLSIGNTNDTYKLDVSGASRILASTYTAGAILYLRDAAATGSNTTFGGLFLGSSPGTDFVLGKQSTNAVGSFAIKTGGGTTLFTLADTGAASFTGRVSSDNSLQVKNNGYRELLLSAADSSNRWNLYSYGADESGSNAGGNLYLARYNDDGSYLGQVFSITRSTGALSYTGAATFSSSVTAGAFIPSYNTSYFGTDGTISNYSATNYMYVNGTGGLRLKAEGVGYQKIVLEGGTSNDIWLTTANTERMRITSGGNVGIGTTSPSTKLDVVGSDGIRTSTDQSTSAFIGLAGSASEGRITVSSYGGYQPMTFYTGGSERIRITSGGELLIGKTTNDGVSSIGCELRPIGLAYLSRASGEALILNRTTTTGDLQVFRYGNTTVGSVSVTGSATTYNTSSDYRLKTDYKDFSGLDLVSKIKAYDYEWKSDKSRSYGVIAHELQSVINYAVTGVKDGKDMQGVDYSKIVPVLIKAIQEQQQQIEQLKNK